MKRAEADSTASGTVKNMTKRRWVGLIVGIAVLLAGARATLAAGVFQVSHEIDAEILLSAVDVLADEKLGVYWDQRLTEPVTFMEFHGTQFEPPLQTHVESIWVYIVNHPEKELTLIEPCRRILGLGHEDIAHIHGDVHNLDGERIGDTCERDVVLAPEQIVWMRERST